MAEKKSSTSGREFERKMTKDQVGVICRWAVKTLGLNYTDLAQAMRVTPKTMSRWLKGHIIPRPENLTRINALGDFRYLCNKAFDTPQDVRDWMRRVSRGFNGTTLTLYFLNGDFEKLISVLATVESGSFV